MPNTDLLKSKIKESGMTVTAVAEKSKMLRKTLYNRLNGVSEFKLSEVVALTSVLKLTKKERDEIFFE